MSILAPEPENNTDSPTRRKAIPRRLRFEILRRDGHTCYYCHATDTPLTIDHVVPVALGGTDDPSNLVAACKDCNAGKSSSSPDATTVAQVDEDALRWARAIKRAVEIAEEDDLRAHHMLKLFRDHWHRYHYPDGSYVPLVHDWREQVVKLAHQPAITDRIVMDSVAATMATRSGPDVPFYYFLGVVRNKVADVHESARRLIADGLV